MRAASHWTETEKKDQRGHNRSVYQTANGVRRGLDDWLTRLGRAAENAIERVAPCPWIAHSGARRPHRLDFTPASMPAAPKRQPLYTPAERKRRDESKWTLVQGVLAPAQFLVFLISLGLVIRFLMTGEGYLAATISIVVKTALLYTIMVTGAIWEKVVFGKYLFAPAFFWEDAVSMLVIALHTLYLAAILVPFGTPQDQMMIALAAYAVYAVNAFQFLWKLRVARLEAPQTGAGEVA